jgi:hypothetical protein
MDWTDTAPLVIPVGRALAYAHSQGVVHRDVKPANILLARPDWPLLADFGLAKLLRSQRGITQPGTSLGTPAYLSPEQAVGERVDHRSDIYSLGILLYELLTGQVPFLSDSPVETMLSRLREPPASPRDLNPQISPRLEAIILRTLQPDPDDRYPSMEALVDELSRLPGASGHPTPPVSGDVAATTVTSRLVEPAAVVGPRLIIATSRITLPIPEGAQVLIGRADPHVVPPPDIDLKPYGAASAGVSRRHARLLCRPEGWLLEDLHSTNGTFVNEARLLPGRPVPLRSGDLVRFGTLAVVFLEE